MALQSRTFKSPAPKVSVIEREFEMLLRRASQSMKARETGSLKKPQAVRRGRAW